MERTGQQLYFDNYTPVGDIVVIASLAVIIILVATSYLKKTKGYWLFLNNICFLVLASVANIFHHEWYTRASDGIYTGVYVVRVVYHALLFANLLIYIIYLTELLHLEYFRKRPITINAVIGYVIVLAVDIFVNFSGRGFKINDDGTYVSGTNIFLIGYLYMMSIVLFMLLVYKDKLYKQVSRGFLGTALVSIGILYLQGKHGQNSFTTVAFMFPIFAMLYYVHSNPYNIELGTISAKALEGMVSYVQKKGDQLVLLSLYLPDVETEGKELPIDLQEAIRKYSGEYFKGNVLFQVSDGHVILAAPVKQNPDMEERIKKILDTFRQQYEKLMFDYKIVIVQTTDDTTLKNQYVSFITDIIKHMDINTIHRVEKSDITSFSRHEYILSELADICRGRNLRDPRVLAYCQPVYNIKTGRYDTAEALMRLKLPEIGMVFPDQFITLAEENGYIHMLTEIMLQRTCDEIRYLVKEGYDIKRISVNVSVLEMREERFTEDIKRIISESGIPEDKIAIEITESQNDNDFLVMKYKIDELKDKGIKFYLDDFGTGYSNMERIMELPFDIIKFDRSLVIASGSDERSEKMVGGLAEMFDSLEYSVLYEGVEDEKDENRCTNMSASYLQGYKYSKPIPIMDLKRFVSKLDEQS